MDALAVRVDNAPERIAFPRDANDAHLVNLVIHVQVDFLITRDKDLLSLNDDPAFRHLCPNAQILDPVAFLREMERRQAGAPGTNAPEKGVQ